VISNNSTKKQKNLLSGYWTGVNKLQAQRLRNKLRRDKGSTNLPTPHPFSSLPLESSFNVFNILMVKILKRGIRSLQKYILGRIFNYIIKVLTKKITRLLDKYPFINNYLCYLDCIIQDITLISYNKFIYTLEYLHKNYPNTFNICLNLYNESAKIISGNLDFKHYSLLISLGLFIFNPDNFCLYFTCL
jgi:hypothetical protein